MYIILSFLGVLYLLDLLNKNAYKLLPPINISDFFVRKLAIKEITSVKDYILALVKIYIDLKNIRNINDDDISKFDAAALIELKQFINSDLKKYIEKLMRNNIYTLDKINSHIQCTLRTGTLDFYLSQDYGFVDYSRIKFQSFSEDSPILDLSTKSVSYTYKIKSKHIRFLNPDVKTICEIREILKTLNISQSFSLQSAS
ncbi:hypothetical protein [Acetivibrio cellulolyticus]|uniref:hypothetical protein n=1 Tax=Acetivibrio cellulolyticus TaxID=35830 RepID=UPI0001E2C7A0|nr:hypothetical protein [Acetivibrio cellulolyticus]